MQRAIRHFRDRDKVFNGSQGDWTVCGLAWERQPTGLVTDCTKCRGLLRELADRMRPGQR